MGTSHSPMDPSLLIGIGDVLLNSRVEIEEIRVRGRVGAQSVPLPNELSGVVG